MRKMPKMLRVPKVPRERKSNAEHLAAKPQHSPWRSLVTVIESELRGTKNLQIFSSIYLFFFSQDYVSVFARKISRIDPFRGHAKMIAAREWCTLRFAMSFECASSAKSRHIFFNFVCVDFAVFR